MSNKIQNKYPFDEMIIGDEIACFTEKEHNTIRSMTWIQMKGTGKKFTTQKEYHNNKVIMWVVKRIA